MSQQQMEQDGAAREDDFTSGMDAAFAALEDGDAPQTAEPGRPDAEDAPAAAAAGEAGGQGPATQDTPFQENPQPAVRQPQPQPQEQPAEKTPPVKTVEPPDNIRDELERLKLISPEAAAMALEDSPEGEGLRRRLENYGAEIAQDRAERVLAARREAELERERQVEAVRRHNQNFLAQIERDHPDYVAMMKTPQRQGELAAFQKELLEWIGRQPYSEAAPMMEIARHGRDPREVSGLITKFKSAKAGSRQAHRPDPTAALAIPGRGAPAAPAGIGDADDFNAGFDAGLSSEK